MIAIAVERACARVLADGAEAGGIDPAPGRNAGTEGEVGPARQRDAERLPVQASIQKAEVCRVDVYEHAAGLEHGQVKGQAFDACRGDTQFTTCARDTLFDGTDSIGPLSVDVIEHELVRPARSKRS